MTNLSTKLYLCFSSPLSLSFGRSSSSVSNVNGLSATGYKRRVEDDNETKKKVNLSVPHLPGHSTAQGRGGPRLAQH